MVEIGRVNFNKPVVVIYNPNSGKKRDVRSEIIKLLNERQIEY
jgi:hypothetical protein